MEKAFFPMKTFNLTQGYGNKSYSHKYNMALDLSGKDSGIDQFFAPFTGIVKRIYSNDANELWLESIDKVLCADGVERYLVMLMAHANNTFVRVGQKIEQGQYMYDEGTRGNVTGNHVHIEIGEGRFTGNGWFKNNKGTWQINNPIAPENILWLKPNTEIKNTIYQGKNYMMRVDEGINNTFNVGDMVELIGPYATSANSKSANNTKLIGSTRYITKIYPNTNFPYQIGNKGKTDSRNTTGFDNANSLKKI